jgi:crotonobetainyl-CoA:carnitine CoA-transferase CaiB-like acyl-CoA transferase
MRPLQGIKVLDLSRAIAGPLCAQALGDLGAEVVKVESPGLGDETRGWPPFKAEGLGAVFLSFNRNKRAISIDLKTAQGRALVHALARQADVVIESFSTGVAERLEIDAKTLQGLNPRLVHCGISGFGRSGPLRHAPGYDVILQAFGGIMALTGEPDGGNIRSPVSPIDQMTGTHAVIGILAALMERDRTGQGGTVQASLFDTAMALQRYNLQMFWTTGVQPPKNGSGHESLCPYQAFEALDGPVLIGVANDNLWRKFCPIAGLHDMADDARFRTNAERAAHRALVVTRVQAAVASQPVAYWYEQLSAAGVPCSPINDLGPLLSHPHTVATGIVMDYEHPAAGPAKAIAQPFVLNEQPRTPGLPPPTRGQHTDAILRELGIATDEIQRLRAANVVA